MKKIAMFMSSLIVASLVAPLGLLAPSVSAAAACDSNSVRWSTTSNTITISGGAICTPAQLSALRPAQITKPAGGVYFQKVNIKLIEGSSYQIHGNSFGGDVAQYRLLSNNNSSSTATVNITGDVGTVSIKGTSVTSWDESANGPDTEYSSTNRRAFIRVRSRYVSGVAQTGRMDIINSDVSYLGYYAAESYGLVWKVMDNAFANVDVLGDIKNSHIHHNYFGVYTYGAFGMIIDSNEVNNNIGYGLDPHDDSDSLIITNNYSHHNGNHGIICSQRCDNLIISNNRSEYNTGHGIMLHRSTDYTLVENNTVIGNSDTGIALFESNNNTVRGNNISGNKNSIRLSVGSSYNTFENNIVSNTNGGNAIYTYKGSDTPARPGNNGVNKFNTWKNNKVSDTKGFVIKLTSTDSDSFLSNDFRGNSGAKYDLSGAVNVTWSGNLKDSGAPSAIK